MNLRIIIAEDETLSRDMLLALLSEISLESTSLEIIATCATGSETLRAVEAQSPDLLLLDINMPDGDGMSVAKNLFESGARLPSIVFTTAHAEYAADAFEIEAVDYLLKPIQLERLQRAIERAIEIHRADNQAGGPKMIAVPILGGVEMLDAAAIEWVEADGDYVRLYAGSRSFHLRKTLSAFLADYEPLFRQTHRSYLVNLHHVVKMIPRPKGEALLQTRSGGAIPVSRSRRAVLEELTK